MSTEFNAWAPLGDDEIAAYAYFLWEADGRPHGRDQDHWYQAKALLTVARCETTTGQTTAPSIKPTGSQHVDQPGKQVGALVKSNAVKKAKKTRQLEAVGA